jgi:hypothetical protein
VYAGIVMLGIMMEQKEVFYLRLKSQIYDVIQTGVAPPTVSFVFVTFILGVHDKDVATVQKLQDFLVFVPGQLGSFFVTDTLRAPGMGVAIVWLIVRKESDGTGGSEQAVPDTNSGVVSQASLDADGANLEMQLLELFYFYIGGHFPKANGKVGILHLAVQDIVQAIFCAFVPEDMQMILRSVKGKEKREALDVIPVGVSQQQAEIKGFSPELFEQGAPERAEAGAAVEDDDLSVRTDFDAGRIAPIIEGGWAGGGNGSTNTPKFHA